MKKYFVYISMALAAGLAFVSCDDNKYLQEDPKTIYTVDNAFAKSSQVDAQLARTYYKAHELNMWACGMQGLFGGASQTLMGYGSDVIETNGASTGFGGAFSNYSNLDALNGSFGGLWDNLYQLASYANLAIYGSEQVTFNSDAEKNSLVAQAKFFLGWAYLRLGECFGGVPIVPEFNQDLRYDYTRNTRQEVYAFAIDCFKEAANGVPDHPADGRIGKGVANHFLAEAYIAQGIETGDKNYFSEAVKAANITIGLHPLMTKRFGVRANPSDTGTTGMFNIPNYRPDGNVFFDLFQIGNYNYSEGNTEALWVLQNATYEEEAASGGIVNWNAFGCAQPYRDVMWSSQYKEANSGSGPWSSDSNIDMDKYPFGSAGPYCGGSSWGVLGSTDYLDEDVWAGEFADDYRNAECVSYYPKVMDKNHSLYDQVITKDMLMEPSRYMKESYKVILSDGWGWDPHCIMQCPQFQYGRDWYAARSAETYLLLAEAQLRNGNKAEAAKAVNALRERANCSKLFTDGEIDIYTILDERARELAWEEQRWPTLLRMASSSEENVVMHTQIMAHAQYVHDCPMYTGGTPKWSLFPIPQSVIQLNTEAELTQNIGW